MLKNKRMIGNKKDYAVYTKDGQVFHTVAEDMVFFEGILFFGDLKISPDIFAYAVPLNENE